MKLLAITEVAERRDVNVAPRVISDAFYQGRLDRSKCPVVGGRRLIPLDYLPELKSVLTSLGKMEVASNG